MAMKITFTDKEVLKKIAITAMTGKGAETAKDLLSEIIVKAVQHVAENQGAKAVIDIDNVKLEKKAGGRVEDTELIEGIVLDKEKLHPGMPSQVKEARITLLDCPLEIKNPEIDAKISITDPEKMQAFIDMEERMLKKLVEKIASTGANVVFCQKGVDDLVQHFLSKKGIFGARRVRRPE